MDIEKTLAKGHSKRETLQIADYVGVNKIRFKKLINLYLAGPYRITQRAAWPLSYCVQRHPHLIIPYWKMILDFLNRPGTPIAVRRNTIRMMQYTDIPLQLQGKVIDLCFKYLSDRKEAIAVRVFSMTVLAELVNDSKELKQELKIVIEDQLPYASAGFMSRARKVLKQISQ
jgi:hypothetical protein